MKNSKHSKKADNGDGLKKFTKVWSMLYFVLAVAFAAVLIYMDVLPLKFLCIAIGAVAIITLLVFPALYSPKFKKSRRIIALVLSIILMIGYGIGIAYIMGTLDFLSNISGPGVQTADYNVLVKADSPYEEIDQIQGKTVYTYMTNDVNYSAAKSMLSDKEAVTYEMSEDLEGLADGLLNGDYEVVFVSAAHYDTICGEKDSFAEQSKILYTVKVPIESKDISKNVDVTKEAFNIYISGLDTEGSIDVVSRSDVNMLVTVNPATHKILLTSIPRDYYIKLPGKDNAGDKLTHSGLYGIEETVATVEQLLGIDINYYVKVNYSTVTSFVDAIDGVDVDSDYTFTTSGMAAQGLNGMAFTKGQNHLDGRKALAFARERHSFPDGDNQRVKNQQKIVKAMIQKATSSTTILTKYTAILDSLNDLIQINMTPSEMQSLVKMQLGDMRGWDIESIDMVGAGITTQCYSTGDLMVYAMDPDQADIIETVDKIVAVMKGQAASDGKSEDENN